MIFIAVLINTGKKTETSPEMSDTVTHTFEGPIWVTFIKDDEYLNVSHPVASFGYMNFSFDADGNNTIKAVVKYGDIYDIIVVSYDIGTMDLKQMFDTQYRK